jgi:hypothetical protein
MWPEPARDEDEDFGAESFDDIEIGEDGRRWRIKRSTGMPPNPSPGEIVAALKQHGFEARLVPAGYGVNAVVVADLIWRQRGWKHPRELPPFLAQALWPSVNAVAHRLEREKREC